MYRYIGIMTLLKNCCYVVLCTSVILKVHYRHSEVHCNTKCIQNVYEMHTECIQNVYEIPGVKCVFAQYN